MYTVSTLGFFFSLTDQYVNNFYTALVGTFVLNMQTLFVLAILDHISVSIIDCASILVGPQSICISSIKGLLDQSSNFLMLT